MNLARVDQIAKAVLYEGYMLYPYRPSAVKNRQRWNFGVLYPQAYCDAHDDGERAAMKTECLLRGSNDAILEVRVRFLHLQVQSSTQTSQTLDGAHEAWQQAIEREVSVPECTMKKFSEPGMRHEFVYSLLNWEGSGAREADGATVRREAVQGVVDVGAEKIRDGLFKVSIRVRNTTPCELPPSSREEALLRALVSAHVVLGIEGGEFISLLDPPDDLRELAAQCQNMGAWPVLVGNPGQRDTLLASPIILYDYPQIAPESAGDLFDGTEIDEILSLRIMALTDEEKREMRQSDDRAREILDRTEAMPAEQFMKLHGAVRGLRPLKEDAR